MQRTEEFSRDNVAKNIKDAARTVIGVLSKIFPHTFLQGLLLHTHAYEFSGKLTLAITPIARANSVVLPVQTLTTTQVSRYIAPHLSPSSPRQQLWIHGRRGMHSAAHGAGFRVHACAGVQKNPGSLPCIN